MISKILFFSISFAFLVFAQDDIRIISSNSSSIIIEYTPQYIDSSKRIIDNRELINIELRNGFVEDSEIAGNPLVPERRINIGVPAEFGNTITVLNASYIEKSGLISPSPFYIKDGEMINTFYKVESDYYNYKPNDQLVAFGDYGILRGVNLQTIRIFPVHFDVNSSSIKLYKKIVFQINYAQAQNVNSNVEDELLKYTLINYDVSKNWIKKRAGRLNKSVTNSVLATGEWVRFEAPDEGIYKIDRALLSSFGIDPAGLDPRTIKIYNNGGKVLPEGNFEPRPEDLVENALLVIGENDGSFDDNDYILFYGRGSSFWDFDSSSFTIKRFNHPYSTKNYYWITYGGDEGKRIEDKASLNTTPNLVTNNTIAFADFEEDKINLAKSGREFFGDDFSESVSSRTYLTKLDGRINSFPIKYKFRFVNASSGAITLQVQENSNTIYNRNLNGYGSASYTRGISYIGEAEFTQGLPDNRSVLKFNFSAGSVTSLGYLDYFEITYQKELKAFDNRILFFSPDSTGIIEYYLNGFASTNIEVFDVSDFANVKRITEHVLLSGGDCRFQVNEQENIKRKYYAVGSNQYYTPVNSEKINNSNLHGIDQGAKFIIVSHPNFLEAANRLKEYRENEAKVPISTIVVNVEEIYNEFSGGNQDVSAIRDFIRYAYQNWQIEPEYFLLFGKGTYDFKNVEGFSDNFIPTWQTQESLILIFGGDSYTSDDFFARIDGDDSFPDIAWGRLTVRTLQEANDYVNKVIFYEQNSERGSWRNLITLVADDGFASNGRYEGSEHTAPSERLANVIVPPSYNFKKIYAADYPVVITGSGRRKPEANKDIIETMNQGTLLINYIGHGNPDLWAHEHIFERNVAIPQLENDKYFFLCAATCDFGYFDIPNFQSGAEELLYLPNAGSIATFNSARLVFSGQNHQLNYTLMGYLTDSPRDTLNLTLPIGYSSYRTKVDWNSVNAQKFHLLGDPTLRLAIPQNFGSIDSINGQPLITEVQIKALSTTKISGTILKPDSTKWNDYNGEGLLTVFDSERIKLLEEIDNYPMVIQGGVIFRGRVSVNNGEFSAEFVVPKDISYENKNGKIQFYFFDPSSDGLAFTNKIIVGGTDTTAVNDGEGPEIEIFFDDATYRNAYLVGPEPKLIVKLYDETGLNTTGTGVGHKMEGIINEDESDPIDFTNFFTGELDAGGKRGEINYNFSPLSEGDYNLLVKAWDVFNNFSDETSFFTVVNDNSLVVRDVYNYPNPFSSNTTFTFQHNLNKNIDVKIKVYTIAGRLIKELEENNINQKFVKIDWDGRDADGDILGNGTYFYKLIVRTTDGEFTQSVIGKMAVIK